MRPSHRDDKLFTVEVAYRIYCKLFASVRHHSSPPTASWQPYHLESSKESLAAFC